MKRKNQLKIVKESPKDARKSRVGLDLFQRERFFNLSLDMLCIAGFDGFFKQLNPAWEKTLGFTIQELKSKPFIEFVHPDDRKATLAEAKKLISGKKTISFENRYICKNGTYKWLRWSSSSSKKEQLLFAVARDITKRKQAEEQIRLSLKEKEVLLKELHHRVKNNLQVIISLLSLQSEKLEDQKAFRVFQECQNRIRSIAAVHEKLYKSDSFSRVEFKNHIQTLIEEILSTFGVNSKKIRVNIKANKLYLPIDKAIPCSLIINEIVSNSLIHAFPEDVGGEISIELSNETRDRNRLIISDDGIGFSKDFTPSNTGITGMEIVKALVEQLDGEVVLKKGIGTKFEISFPV